MKPKVQPPFQWPEQWKEEPFQIDWKDRWKPVKVSSFYFGYDGEKTFNFTKVYIGVDPGAKTGIAVLTLKPLKAAVFQIDTSKLLWPQRGMFMLDRLPSEMLRLALKEGDLSLAVLSEKFSACIERAAYGAKYGQVPLAEHRAAVWLGFEKLGIQTIAIPPQTIRKEVFGHGHTKASEVWTHLPEDAADALACAYYLYKIKEG